MFVLCLFSLYLCKKFKAMEQQQQVTEKQFYTTRQVCEYFDLASERTVLDLIRAKELRARKVFNKYIIEHSAIAEYIQNQKANF